MPLTPITLPSDPNKYCDFIDGLGITVTDSTAPTFTVAEATVLVNVPCADGSVREVVA